MHRRTYTLQTVNEWIYENFISKGKAIAIFYCFDREGVELRKRFKNSTDNPESFQKGESNLFIGQVRTVREGVKLDKAESIVFYNIGFSSADYIQARQRLQSKDRESQPTAHFIFARGGIEDSIYKTVKNKKNFTARYYKS